MKKVGKCEACGHEGQAKDFIMTGKFPIWDKTIEFSVCNECWRRWSDMNEMIRKKYEEEK